MLFVLINVGDFYLKFYGTEGLCYMEDSGH